MAAVEEGGGAGEDLGRKGREGEVPAGEDDGCGGVSGVRRAMGRGGSWGEFVRYPEFVSEGFNE